MVRINYARARVVFARALDCYQARRYPYEDLENRLPQNQTLPEIKRNPVLFARFLFAACLYMRGTVPSGYAFQVMNSLWLEHPWLFDERVLNRPLSEIQSVLRSKIVWRHMQIGRFWQHNFRILFEDWGGDPRNIFSGIKTKKAMYRRVMGGNYRQYKQKNGKRVLVKSRYRRMYGYREKMVSMLAYFLEATKLMGYTPLSAPIDYHHFRFYLATEMIEIFGESIRYEKVTKIGIRLAELLQKEFGLTQVEYADIVWLWSLRLCRTAPQTTCRTVEFYSLDGTRNDLKVPITVNWEDSSHVRAFHRSCGVCEVASFCSSAIPSGVYYRHGKFLLIPRTEPPQRSLFDGYTAPRQMRPKRKQTTDEFLQRFGIRLRADSKEVAHGLETT